MNHFHLNETPMKKSLKSIPWPPQRDGHCKHTLKKNFSSASFKDTEPKRGMAVANSHLQLMLRALHIDNLAKMV